MWRTLEDQIRAAALVQHHTPMQVYGIMLSRLCMRRMDCYHALHCLLERRIQPHLFAILKHRVLHATSRSAIGNGRCRLSSCRVHILTLYLSLLTKSTPESKAYYKSNIGFPSSPNGGRSLCSTCNIYFAETKTHFPRNLTQHFPNHDSHI